jgi:hypothetical protein
MWHALLGQYASNLGVDVYEVLLMSVNLMDLSSLLRHALQELLQLAEAGKLGKDVLISSSSSSREQQHVMRSSKFCLALSVSEQQQTI